MASLVNLARKAAATEVLHGDRKPEGPLNRGGDRKKTPPKRG